ncbi:MAG: ParB/RepB/Spo0J family partition protein [Phycisphaerales bacterium]|nr:ParB/RepB/Spo0J family partition protein [Phycisphaerales bacterium]
MKTVMQPLADLHPDPGNPRKSFPDETLAELAQSIREVGLLFPLRVRQNGAGYVIVDGERRFHAAKLAGLTELPVIIEEDLSEPDVTRRQLIANCQREDLKPLEIARGVQSLMASAGWTASEAARRLGFSESKVSRLLALLSLPEDVQAQVAAGAISASAGYALSQVQDTSAQSQLAADAAAGRITREAITRRARRKVAPPTNGKVPARITAQLGSGRSVTLAGPGLADVETLIAWLTELVNEARKARDLELTTFARLLRDRAKPAKRREA